MRMLERALIRAGLPLVYTQGFNPHVKLSLPLPRPVGAATEADPVFFHLTENWPPAEIESKISRQLPTGARVAHVEHFHAGQRPELFAVRYEVPVPSISAHDLPQAIDRLILSDCTEIERQDVKGRAKGKLNIRPLVKELSYQYESLEIVALVKDGRTLALKDLMRALDLPWQQLRHKVRRTKVEWR